jgi:predicted dehydrogenase
VAFLLEEMMSDLRFAAFGAGFWTRFQLSGWREIPGAQCVAIYNRTRAKAEAYAREFQIPSVYDDAESLFRSEKLDFVDIVTSVETHEELALMALRHHLPVLCQKPLAPNLAAATRMVRAFEEENLPLLVNDNWRWQSPIRKVKELLDGESIGRPFRARVDMISGFPVFRNQPFLKDLPQFILTDLGTHILDVCRFLFGEVRSVYCKTSKVHADIAGEDVATVVLEMNSGATVVAEMAYAGNYLEDECFPQTKIFVEGGHGSMELKPGYKLHLTTQEGTRKQVVPPVHFPWADPEYDVVHSSIVPCQTNLLRSLQGRERAETTGIDNLETLRLVYASYESAESGQAVPLS